MPGCALARVRRGGDEKFISVGEDELVGHRTGQNTEVLRQLFCALLQRRPCATRLGLTPHIA